MVSDHYPVDRTVSIAVWGLVLFVRHLARRLRAETTMSLKWIAGELHMGSWTYVSNLLSQKAHKSVNSED